jgi:hypothetical protein
LQLVFGRAAETEEKSPVVRRMKDAGVNGFTPTRRMVLAARMHGAGRSFATGDKRESALEKYLGEKPDCLDN